MVIGPRALAGMGQLSQARRERDKERRRQKEADFKKEREKERMKKEPTRRALPSEPSIPSIDPNSAEAKKKEQKLREREKEREKERERQLREREKRVGQRSSRHQDDDYEREKERQLRERQREREKRLEERERRKRRETYAGEYETRDRDEYLDSRRSRHTRGMSHSPIPPPPRHSGRGGASPIPPHRGGASPIPPHRGGASPIPPHRGERGGPSPIPPQRGGASPIPPHRGERGHSPIPPHRGSSDPRGHSPIPPHRGNSDPQGHSPIPPRRGDERGGQSPIPPLRTDRGGHSPIPPNRRQTMYEMYGDQYHTDYDDMDDGYGGQLALTHSHSHSLPPPPPPPQQSHQANHPTLPPLQTVQPLYSNANSSQAQLYSNPNSSQVFNHPNGSFVSLPSPDGPPPPPPPHRHIQGQPSNPQLRNQLPQPPQPLLLKHQASHMTLQHKPSQMQLATVQKQPTRKLKHQASVADWAATQEIEIDPRKIPAGAIAVLPKVGQLKQRPRAPSSTYTSAPDFEALAKPDAPNNDEFDDTGRFAPGVPPPKPMPRVTNPNTPTDINAGALVPAGYNYTATDPPGYWKPPPFGNSRPRSGSDSTAMVITNQKQRPPPPQYNSAANSRRNSFIGDNPIPPSLIPGIDPTLAELIAEDERREKEMALAAVGAGGGAGGGQITQQGHQQQPHALPPAPYIEEVNDREDGGRRKSANGAAGLQLVAGGGKGPGVAQAPQLTSTAEGGHQAQVQAVQLVKHRFSYPHPQQPPHPKYPPFSNNTKQLEHYASSSAHFYSNHNNNIAYNQTQQLTHPAKSDGPSPGSANRSGTNSRATLEPIVPPPQPPSRAKTKRLDGIPFSPDAYNLINPKPSKMPPPARGGTVIIRNATNAPAANTSTSTSAAAIASTNTASTALVGRKPDEILPPESFAPEPEVKPKSAAQLQAEADAEMQVQWRKARGITGVRDMVAPQPPPYLAQKLPIAIPERGSSSRAAIGQRKQLALPPTDGGAPPPPPGHQTLVVVGGGNGNISPTKAGTVRNKLQKVRPQKSIDAPMHPNGNEIAPYSSSGGQLNQSQQHQQSTSLSIQIAQHEARMKREAEHAAQRRAAAEAKTREEKARRDAAYNPNRHSIAGPPVGLAGYRDSYARHSTATLPGYESIDRGEGGEEGAMVLHRNRTRSAEPVWEGGAGGRRSYDAGSGSGAYNTSRGPSRVPSQNDLSRVPSYAELQGNEGGYDNQGMVLYRPGGSGGGGSTSSGVSSGAGAPYNGYGGGGGYGSGVSNSGSNTSYGRGGRARGGSEPPRPGYNGSGGGGYAAQGQEESMALMSREEWLLSQELKGISIGVGSTAGSSSNSGGGGRSGGTVARRGGGRGY